MSLVTDPPGALVRLHRYELQDRRLVPVLVGELGVTPLVEVALPRGSYLLTVHRDGHHDVRYPVAVGRGEHWHGVRPGDTGPHPIRLPRLGVLGADDCHVPAGWFVAGGDPEAIDSLPRQRVWVDAFSIRRHPVTNREYLAFLNGLVAAGREEEALRCVPRTSNTADFKQVYHRVGGQFISGSDHNDRAWLLDWPVAGVDWFSAVAAAEAAGQRLPHELEWEKAARGVDGRSVAWGEHIEPTWASMIGCRDAPPMTSLVDSFPGDVSPYGVRGTVGNVRDFCGNSWEKEGPTLHGGLLSVPSLDRSDAGYRSSRGGAWSSVPSYCRAAMRYADRPRHRFSSLGFRLVR